MGTNGRRFKVIFGALLLVVAIGALLNGALMGPGMLGPGMMWGYGGTQPFGTGWARGLAMGFGMLLTLAFWVAVIVGVVLLVRWAVGSPSGATAPAPPERPRDILRHRYAAGGDRPGDLSAHAVAARGRLSRRAPPGRRCERDPQVSGGATGVFHRRRRPHRTPALSAASDDDVGHR